MSTAGFSAQISTLGRQFWLSNVIEMLERFSFYGLRTVVTVYLLLAVELGGPQLDNLQKGSLLAMWAAIQSFVPILSGGLSDRLGYRGSVAIAAVIKACGYLVMGLAIPIATLLSAGASQGHPGHPVTYGVLLVGAGLIALGTAIFKPGIQGLVAVSLNPENNSLGWGIFYQVINLGGFLGPILAAWLRVLDWVYVFVACAAIALSMIPVLLLIEEPPRSAEVAKESMLAVGWRTIIGILEPRLLAFLAIFSGFWAMFHQLFDMLPNFIDDWVDTRGPFVVLAWLLAPFGGAPAGWNGHVPQEMMLNINAGMIMILAFAVGYLSGRIRSMTSMLIGIGVCGVAILLLDTNGGWPILGAIALFSFGEMLASPTKLRYMTEIAPPGRKGAYLGYVNATDAVGWTIGSWIAGALYETHGDKVALAREHLVTALHIDPVVVKGLAKTDVLPRLAAELAISVPEAQALLWATYDPGQVWLTFAKMGFISMIGLFIYDRIVRNEVPYSTAILIALMTVVTLVSYGPRYGVIFLVLGLIGAGLQQLSTVETGSTR